MRYEVYHKTRIPERGLCVLTATHSLLASTSGGYTEVLPLTESGSIDHTAAFALLDSGDLWFELYAVADPIKMAARHAEVVARVRAGKIRRGDRAPTRGTLAVVPTTTHATTAFTITW